MSKARDLVIGYDPTAAVEPFTNQAMIVEADSKATVEADSKVTGGATSDDYYETFSAGLAAAAAAQWKKSITGGSAPPAGGVSPLTAHRAPPDGSVSPLTAHRAPPDGSVSPLTAHLLTLDYEEESYDDIADDIGGCHDDADHGIADINAALEGGEPGAAPAAGLLDAVIAG